MPSDYLVWTPWGLPGTLAGLYALTAAAFIWRTTRSPAIRTRFSALLASEGVMMLTGITGLLQFLVRPDHVYWMFTLHVLNDCALIAFYLPALAAAVDTPMLRPFRRPTVRRLIAVFGGVLAVGVLVAPPQWLHHTIAAPTGMGSAYTVTLEPANGVIFLVLVVSYIYGLIASIVAWRQSATPAERRQRGALSLAFACRDITWCGIYVVGAAVAFLPIDPVALMGQPVLLLPFFAHVMYVSLMAYAVAYYSVLEIDLVVKRTIKRSTVAAILFALFFVVSEGSAAILSQQMGTLLGLLVTGLLLFFLAPLQRLGDHMADTAMPAAQDTPEYRSFRRLQIYGAAVEDAVRNGGLSGARRLALDRLRQELDLDQTLAAEIEERLARDGAP